MANGTTKPADPFRRQYRKLSDPEQKRIDGIKDTATALFEQLNDASAADQRALAIARTKLEECVMWATKAITG